MSYETQHPGYDVIQVENGFWPVRLEGGAKPRYSMRGEYGPCYDEKGRYLSERPQPFPNDGRVVYRFLYEGSEIYFDNPYHAHNFLNKWVREMVGLVYAAETWLAYQEQQANRVKDLPAILDSLESKQHKYETIARAHEAAAALVKLIDEGKLDKDTARQIFEMCVEQSAYDEVKNLYRELLEWF